MDDDDRTSLHDDAEDQGGSAETPPPVPDSDDPTPAGDTDQHSYAQA